MRARILVLEQLYSFNLSDQTAGPSCSARTNKRPAKMGNREALMGKRERAQEAPEEAAERSEAGGSTEALIAARRRRLAQASELCARRSLASRE